MYLPSPSLSASLSSHHSGQHSATQCCTRYVKRRKLKVTCATYSGVRSPVPWSFECVLFFSRLFPRLFCRLFSRPQTSYCFGLFSPLFFSTLFPTFSRLFVKGCWPHTSYCFGLSGLQALLSLRFCSDSIGWVLFTSRENHFITFLGWLTPTPAQLESRNEPSYCFRLLHVDWVVWTLSYTSYLV